MRYYVGIDLHSNNSYTAVMDEDDKVVFRKRLKNDLREILAALEVYRSGIAGVVVESTYNWHWLVDGLHAAGYVVHLANTTANKPYSGLKYSNDDSDAVWLARLLRLNVLATGYICPKKQRAVRDLLRKRGHLVRQRTGQILSVNTIAQRTGPYKLTGNAIKFSEPEEISGRFADDCIRMSVYASLTMVHCASTQISRIEQKVKSKMRLDARFIGLKEVPGIGDILGLTIALETGELSRFAKVGNYVSYCRCVGSARYSNGKLKGRGNAKNGNKYLSWAYVEAANFAIRYSPAAKRYYERKKAKTGSVVATKALAHKLARACYFVMRDGVPFDEQRCFG